ncbi:MAG: hypothetical protein V1659_02065 [Candidatus Woesearchaeota archaeon]
MTMIEWAVNYVKNKDLFKRELVDFRIEQNTVLFEFKNKKNIFIIADLLDSESIKPKEFPSTIVCLNKKDNLEFLIKNWSAFAAQKELMVIFVNPAANEKWIIKPHIHDQITEKESLRTGLQSMFETVPEAA